MYNENLKLFEVHRLGRTDLQYLSVHQYHAETYQTPSFIL